MIDNQINKRNFILVAKQFDLAFNGCYTDDNDDGITRTIFVVQLQVYYVIGLLVVLHVNYY